MAGLNIGNINFGVEADTSKLQTAIAQLGKFRQEINRVAKSQKDNATQTANVMGRQESAIKKAIQATLNYNKAIAASKMSETQKKAAIDKSAKALNRLTVELTSGKLRAFEFGRAVDGFGAKLGKARRKLTDFNKGVGQGKTKLRDMSVILRDLESSAVLALGPLSGLGARIRSIGAIIGRGRGGFATAALVAIGATVAFTIGLIKLGASAVQATSQMQALNMRFMAATGSMAAGKKEYQFILKLSKSLGLEITTLSKAYSRFLAASQGTSLEGAKSQKIFTQVAKAAASLKLEAQDVEGIMRALEQMMSKGTVQAEELRGQLGDRLPGAFRFAAEAMGVTTRELNRMLKAGEVMAVDLLPKLGDVLEENLGKHAAQNLKTLSGATNNLKTAMFEMFLAADSIPDALIGWKIPGDTNDEITSFSSLVRGVVVDLTRLSEWIAKANAEQALLEGGTKKLSMGFDFERERVKKLNDKLAVVTDGFEEHRQAQNSLIPGQITISDGFTHIGKAAEDAKEPVKDLTGTFGKIGVILDKSLIKLDNTGRILAALKIGKIDSANVETLETLLELLPTVGGLTSDGLEVFADRLSKILDRPVAPSIEAVAKALADVDAQARENEEGIERHQKGIEDLAEAHEVLATLRERVAQTSLGLEEAKEYKEITAKAREYAATIDEEVVGREIKNKMVFDYISLLRIANGLDEEQARVAKAAAKAQREAASAREKANNALDKTNLSMAKLRERAAAFREGADEAAFYDDIKAKADKYVESLSDINTTEEMRNKILEEAIALLKEIGILDDKQKDAAREAKKAATDLERRQIQAEKAVKKANNELDRMHLGLVALATGPDSLEIFEKVLEPLARMEERLIKQNVQLPERNRILERYEQLLNTQLQLTSRLHRAGEAMGDAIGDAFMRMLTDGGSVMEMLKELLLQLTKIWFQAMLLDKLKFSLGNAIGGILSPATVPATGGSGAPGAGSFFGGTSTTGGTFKLPGSGGSDSVPFTGIGKPGEVVSIHRPDQMGGGGGGVTISQVNNFDNANGSPEVLIPILEENNRRLIGQIRDMQSRGEM